MFHGIAAIAASLSLLFNPVAPANHHPATQAYNATSRMLVCGPPGTFPNPSWVEVHYIWLPRKVTHIPAHQWYNEIATYGRPPEIWWKDCITVAVK